MPLAKHIDPEVGIRLQHKAAGMFTCAYIDPTSCEPTRNMTFGSNDEFQVWNEGPPPFPGWWNAHYNLSTEDTLEIWRWWDGEQWTGVFATEHDDAERALHQMSKTSTLRHRDIYNAIKWNDRWPVGARVPRLIPEGHPLECYAGMIGGTVAESSPQLSLPLDDKPLQQQLEESDW